MDTQLTVKNIQHQAWALMVQEQINSGLSVRDWCGQNGLTTKTFYYRRKQVRSEVIEAASMRRFAEITPPASSTIKQDHVIKETFVPQLTIRVDDVTIGVDQRTPRELLITVMEVLRHA